MRGWCRVGGIGYRVSGIRYQVSGIRCRVSGIGWQVSGGMCRALRKGHDRGDSGTRRSLPALYLLGSSSCRPEMIVSYRDLKVWQLGMDLVEQVYTATRVLPSEERYGLTSQARRAAVSIPANIAEGRTRTHVGVYLQHLSVAQGSLAELETHLELARRLGFLDEQVTSRLFVVTARLGQMLNTLVRRLRCNSGRLKGERSARSPRRPSPSRNPIPDTRYPVPSPQPS